MKNVTETEQEVCDPLDQTRRVADLPGMIPLSIRQLAVAVAAHQDRLITKGPPCDMMGFETSRIALAARDTNWIVCAQPLQGPEAALLSI
ncbi:MAG: hypothetical protein KGJ41_17795 [Rhodospirillales bacterium]|nr:hypothetical protein [Rhodospirillales bacterium]